LIRLFPGENPSNAHLKLRVDSFETYKNHSSIDMAMGCQWHHELHMQNQPLLKFSKKDSGKGPSRLAIITDVYRLSQTRKSTEDWLAFLDFGSSSSDNS